MQAAQKLIGGILLAGLLIQAAEATPSRSSDRTVHCDLLVIGGGLAGVATTYEGLLAGRTVCLTEITDWVGGQISAQGTSALDEQTTQRLKLFFPRGYLELRRRIEEYYGKRNPGECWVSGSCFLPKDGHQILFKMLGDAAKRGKGTLHWFPNTVVKELAENSTRTQLTRAIAIQHVPAPGTKPLNTEPLSQTITEAYRYENSPRFQKTIVEFVSSTPADQSPAPPWYVVDATETGEIIALADVPYRQGIDPRSSSDPSASSATPDPFCLQGFTYTFAMEATADPQPQTMPAFYPQYQPYYSYELPRLASFDLVFTYRRIWSKRLGPDTSFGGVNFTQPMPGDISMQNWTWGNDYRPGTAQDNLVLDRTQLANTGQLQPGQWMGGLRTESLRSAEEIAQGYYYWLVSGTTDSQLGDGVKKPAPNHRYLQGLDSPMGTAHGLSKYPYMREGRRIIGRSTWAYPQGFSINEFTMSRKNFRDRWYTENLPAEQYFNLRVLMAGLNGTALVSGAIDLNQAPLRVRSLIYPDSVGIGHYAIDFHPCMTNSPPEAPNNREREGERRGGGSTYPFQVPLRAMIPQRLDNLLVAGKSIATSHIAAAAYRVHSFEWSVGAAAGNVAALALTKQTAPATWVDQLPRSEPMLERLQQQLQNQGNPTAFPDTSVFNETWKDWR
jgi:FAD dependent oxidoreductase